MWEVWTTHILHNTEVVQQQMMAKQICLKNLSDVVGYSSINALLWHNGHGSLNALKEESPGSHQFPAVWNVCECGLKCRCSFLMHFLLRLVEPIKQCRQGRS